MDKKHIIMILYAIVGINNLQGAEESRHTRLLRNQALNQELVREAEIGNIDRVSELLERGADVDAKDSTGCTPLMRASFLGHAKTVGILLERGAGIDVRSGQDNTALMLAAEQGHTGIASLLLDKGADVNIQSRIGRTALMYAARAGHANIVGLLLDNGADVNAQDNEGDTALRRATAQGHVRLLLKRTGDIELAEWERFFRDIENCSDSVVKRVLQKVYTLENPLHHTQINESLKNNISSFCGIDRETLRDDLIREEQLERVTRIIEELYQENPDTKPALH